MLIVGDKIRQTKEICGFNEVGQEFTVVGIDQGTISFSATFGTGMMTWKEYDEHFERVIEIQTAAKRNWSAWKVWDNVSCNIWYKENGKVVIVKYLEKYRGKASCSCGDVFNLQKGVELATARAKVKYAEDVLQKAINECQ